MTWARCGALATLKRTGALAHSGTGRGSAATGTRFSPGVATACAIPSTIGFAVAAAFAVATAAFPAGVVAPWDVGRPCTLGSTLQRTTPVRAGASAGYWRWGWR